MSATTILQLSQDAAQEIHILEERLRKLQVDKKKKMSQHDLELYLKIIETVTKGPLRRPDLVVLCGQEILFGDNTAFRRSIDSIQLWNMYEIVLRNALELNQVELADSCLEAIQNKFGESARVRKLEALVLEGKGEFDESEELYNELLKEVDPTDQFILKRLVAIKKGLGDIPEAIKQLNHYLSIYMSDVDAYSELADLYLSICDYKKAAFCVEEMIINDPNNPLYHCKYADIMYTMEDYKTARKYYAHCINLMIEAADGSDDQFSTMRPVYGLLMACNAISAQNRFDTNGSNTKKANSDLLKLAETLLVKNYSRAESKKTFLPIIEQFLKQ